MVIVLSPSPGTCILPKAQAAYIPVSVRLGEAAWAHAGTGHWGRQQLPPPSACWGTQLHGNMQLTHLAGTELPTHLACWHTGRQGKAPCLLQLAAVGHGGVVLGMGTVQHKTHIQPTTCLGGMNNIACRSSLPRIQPPVIRQVRCMSWAGNVTPAGIPSFLLQGTSSFPMAWQAGNSPMAVGMSTIVRGSKSSSGSAGGRRQAVIITSIIV